ncbi:MAG: histidine phosphatase family protein [Propionibacteriaceae bacterium]|jgi:probable phosphoglycerate mutase|nr:histidine phosphatase family protein [Propionibacteriaceae bacterium]
MRLILLRHGQTDSNTNYILDTGAPGADLNALGREQAEAAVPRLAHFPITGIYASTLVRSQQTAAPLAAQLGLPVRVLDGLREVYAGDDDQIQVTQADLPHRYELMLHAWKRGDIEAKVPGGENAEEFVHRYDQAIAQIEADGNECALAVSHGAALLVWCSARVAGFAEVASTLQFGNTGFVVADGSLAHGYQLTSTDGLFEWGSGESW